MQLLDKVGMPDMPDMPDMRDMRDVRNRAESQKGGGKKKSRRLGQDSYNNSFRLLITSFQISFLQLGQQQCV